MLTLPALASERRFLATDAWRVVESQSQVATMKIVDSLDEQAVLEAELDGSKPVVPASCARLDYLLATPFRYVPYPHGSRFRRAQQREGCFYCSGQVETAMAEAAFYHLKFFLASPGTKPVQNPQERTAFQVSVSTSLAIDLTVQPLSSYRAAWMNPNDYGPCQDFADLARKARSEVIRYESVRDPRHGANLAVLSPDALACNAPTSSQTWRLLLRRDRVDAMREMPRLALSFDLTTWAAIDPSIAATL